MNAVIRGVEKTLSLTGSPVQLYDVSIGPANLGIGAHGGGTCPGRVFVDLGARGALAKAVSP